MTAKGCYATVSKFEQWCRLERKFGGLGLRADQVSLSLILNHRIVYGYITWRITRSQDLELNDQPIGPLLGATEHAIAGFFKSLVDPGHGWLTQSRADVVPLEHIAELVELSQVSSVDSKLVISAPRPIEIMPMDVVTASEEDWRGCCVRSRQFLTHLSGIIGGEYKLIRDSRMRVRPILQHRFPIAVVVSQVVMSLSKCHDIGQCPRRHAKDFRNAVMMLLLITVVFRSGTLRNMTYRADNTGHLRRSAEGYDVAVEREMFKNGTCEWLFGPSFQPRDYERQLGRWGSLKSIIDYYLDVCRPILLDGRKSDLLFPTSKQSVTWSHKTFNRVIANWTREFSVENKRLRTGMPGVQPWGPHAARDIVATHIIKNFEGERRWELAAMILCTGITQVMRRYAWIDSKLELGRIDGLMNDAFELGESGQDLF